MAGTDAIYFGALIDWHNYPTGGLNGQSGFTTYTGSAAAQFNNNLGKRASLYHISGTPSKWGNGTATGGTPNTNAFSALQGVLDASHAQGMLPFVDWSPWDWALPSSNFAFRPAAIAAGNWNTYITQWMTDAKTWGKSILIRPMWEQQLTWAPWMHGTSGSWTIPSSNGWGGTWTNSISDWKNAWAKIRSLRDSVGATNVKMSWVPNRHASSETATTYALIAPPMSQVDWLGIDTYPDYGQTLGNALRGTGGMTYLTDNYADLCALDSAKPIILGEFAFAQSNNTSVTVNSITANGATWTISVAGAPGSDTWSAGGNAIALDGQAPSGYLGEWDIVSVSGTGPFTIVVNNTSQPGAVTTLGSARFINRVGTASLITTSLETDLPAMPRIRALAEYHVVDGWPDDHHPLDVDGSHTSTTSFLAFKNAIGNAHYLAGQQIASDTSTKVWVPFQDQPVTQLTNGQPTAQERYLDVLRSTLGLEAAWPLTEAAGATTAADVSGKARNATYTGSVGLGTAGSLVPAEPSWPALLFPGTAGNHVDCGNNAAYSITTTGKLSIEIPFLIPSTSVPTAQSTLISKCGFSGQLAGAVYEYQGWVSGTQLGFTINQTNGASWASWTIPLPSLDVPHLLQVCIDTTLAQPIVVDLDGVTQVTSTTITAGVGIAAGTAPLYIGEKFDSGSHLPMSANGRIGIPSVCSVFLSRETRVEHYNVWLAGPAISGLTASISGNVLTATWNTDVGGSTQLEWGPTTAYGNLSTYQAQRITTTHTASTGSLAPGTTHFRARSRNSAGTETLTPDQTVGTAGAAPLGWFT